MANTTYITKAVEPFLVNWVGEQLGEKLYKKRVELGTGVSGNPVRFEFDGVNEPKTIGVLASASKSMKPGAVRKLVADAAILLASKFEKRVMVFSYHSVKTNFENQFRGVLDLERIDFMVHPGLPEPMQATLELIHSAASNEQLSKSDKTKPSRHRR